MTEVDISNKSSYLETMIDCIHDRNRSPKKEKEEEPTLNKLYGQAGQMINEFDTSINRCKKYNEAKINRKYEIIIKDLEAEVKKLNEKLKLEQDARSPTKKHISDILDKLVSYRQENEKLKKTSLQALKSVKDLQQQLETQKLAMLKMQNQQPKALVERLPALSQGGYNVADAIKEFMKDKEKVRRITSGSVSSFQNFLKQKKAKIWNWNITDMLQEIDSWGEGVKEKPSIDMWRIRSSIAHKFSDYLDDPSNITKPTEDMDRNRKVQSDRMVRFRSGHSYKSSKHSLLEGSSSRNQA